MILFLLFFFFFFFNDTATTEIYTLSLHDALPIYRESGIRGGGGSRRAAAVRAVLRCARARSEEHTSELQSQSNIVCRLLLEKKKKQYLHSAHQRDATYTRLYSVSYLLIYTHYISA